MDGLSSICAGLGTLEEDDNGNHIGYEKGEYCSDNLKDLLRYLRRDDPEKRDVFKQVCKWNTVGKDLIPIMEYYQEDRNLTLTAVKILVFLTMPVEHTSMDIPQQIEYLWGLKSAITFSNTVPLIVSVLENPLENLENESFTEDDWKLVQLVLTLFRNILAIQDLSSQQKAGRSASEFLSLRDKFLDLLFQENVMDLFIVLSQHTGGSHGYLRQDNLLLLEIFNDILKGQNPELIAKIHLKGPKVDEAAENSMSSLQSIIKEEQDKIKLARLHKLSCYSQFSGTYTRVTLDGSKALFKGNPCSASLDVLRRVHKNHRGPSKRTIWDHDELPSTKNQILESLYEFIDQFLTGGYNVLMQSVREDIDKEHQEIQRSDIVTFFQVAQFVTSFQYHKCLTSKSSNDTDKEASVSTQYDATLFNGCICGPVSETLNESMFLTVISQCRNAFESLKQTKDHTLLSAAGFLVKAMVQMLDLVLKESLEDSNEPRTARILLYKLFYDQTEEGMTQFFLNLIKSFDTHKQAKSDLSNLVETIYVVVWLMENLQARGTIRVSKKGRKKKTKKAMTKEETVSEPGVHNATIQKEDGSFACEQFVSTNFLEKETITNQIQEFVKETDRSVGDSFNIDETVLKPANLGSIDSEIEGRVMSDKNDDLYLGTDDSADDEQLVVKDEVDFKVSSLVSSLANNTIVRNLCWLLKFYRINSISTNHSILSILRRICDDLELYPILYQLSLLTVFYEILEEQKLRPSKEYENIVNFLTSLVRRMLRKMKNYPLLAVEVLFWKTRKECHYITCGSMLNEFNHVRNKNGKGRNDTSDDRHCHPDASKWVRKSISDALGDDDFEETCLKSKDEDDPSEAKFQDIECEISDSEGHPGKEYLCTMPKRRNGFIHNDEMEARLYDLYEKVKDNSDCCQLIAGELDPNGKISKLQISKSLKRLGIKVSAQKKMQNSGNLNQHNKSSNCDLQNITMESNLTDLNESSPLRKHVHSRKRVQVISVDQEQKIKEFFEQFKDQKRCSYMIANALDDTGKISAAQVSHKLKKLGLVVPKKKRSNANLHLKDDVFSDVSSEAGKSDDKTLLPLRNRSKHRLHGSHDEKHNEKFAPKLSEDMSDDELISSILVKKKKMSTDGDEEELMTDSTQTNMMVERNLNFENTQSSDRKDMDMEIAANVNQNSIDSKSETIEMAYENVDSPQNPLIDDDLADFEDDMDSIGSRGNNVIRRRARMVIDFEDDD